MDAWVLWQQGFTHRVQRKAALLAFALAILTAFVSIAPFLRLQALANTRTPTLQSVPQICPSKLRLMAALLPAASGSKAPAFPLLTALPDATPAAPPVVRCCNHLFDLLLVLGVFVLPTLSVLYAYAERAFGYSRDATAPPTRPPMCASLFSSMVSASPVFA